MHWLKDPKNAILFKGRGFKDTLNQTNTQIFKSYPDNLSFAQFYIVTLFSFNTFGASTLLNKFECKDVIKEVANDPYDIKCSSQH